MRPRDRLNSSPRCSSATSLPCHPRMTFRPSRHGAWRPSIVPPIGSPGACGSGRDQRGAHAAGAGRSAETGFQRLGRDPDGGALPGGCPRSGRRGTRGPAPPAGPVAVHAREGRRVGEPASASRRRELPQSRACLALRLLLSRSRRGCRRPAQGAGAWPRSGSRSARGTGTRPDHCWTAFARDYQGDPRISSLDQEIQAARNAARDEHMAQLDAARKVNDPDRVLEVHKSLVPLLEAEARASLEADLSRWFLRLIHNRLRTGRIQADLAHLAGRIAESFSHTVDGASLHASLPTLRRSAGLCPRCAQPYTGVAEACPDCLELAKLRTSRRSPRRPDPAAARVRLLPFRFNQPKQSSSDRSGREPRSRSRPPPTTDVGAGSDGRLLGLLHAPGGHCSFRQGFNADFRGRATCRFRTQLLPRTTRFSSVFLQPLGFDILYVPNAIKLSVSPQLLCTCDQFRWGLSCLV